ncbi:MAG: PSD1 domain-containing protein [Planctomycetaceae bacterium]|nr:PSD1 domain-containing protein [Planctomycetaceae bacterium]
MFSNDHVLRVMLRLLLCGWAVSSSATVLAIDEPAAPVITDSDRDFFEKQVRPLLVRRCFECHGGNKAEGGLSLASANGWAKGGDSGPAIVPGNPHESLLIKAVHHRSLEMPPSDRGGKLPAEEIEVFEKWVALGAPDPRTGTEVLGGMTREEALKWWAFQPLPEIPTATLASDVQHIDDLLQREIDRHELEVAPRADKRTLLRRVTYGLTGLPPSPTEVNSFLEDDSSEAWARIIDRLLASPHYGEHWGRRWLDVVRYADTAGENTDRPLPHAWRYRNWVIESLQNDLPFDQFIRLQLAGDLLVQQEQGPARADGIIATGYLAIARRFGHDIDKDMYLTYEDVIDNVGKNFLGLSLGCARCHDHKYDPISAEDYYALYGIFASTKFSYPGCEPFGQPRDLMPLLSTAETETLMQPWREKVAAIEAEKLQRAAVAESARQTVASLWTEHKQELFAATIAEGSSVGFEKTVQVRRGEVLVLTVLPNGNHGADSTQVEWTIQETSGTVPSWRVTDTVPNLLQGNPWTTPREAVWSFLEVTAGPTFLNERRDNLSGRGELKAWSIGSEPSVFVNSAPEPISVWTSLPAQSFFVHPGHERPVAITWTSPMDGELLLTGRVTDAHPAGGLDGVSCQLAHVAAPEFGLALAALGNATSGLPDPGPPPTIPVAYAVMDQTGKNAKLQERGDPELEKAEVPRRWLSIFGGQEVASDSGSGRRELSNWVSQHPLAARVMVNRIWEWHFGNGLVRSANDFGARGQSPTHPELLDFLAVRFVQSGYSIKAMQRLILQTQAYQRASSAVASAAVATADAASSAAATADAENRWLAHFNRRRLTAEELRDSLLTVSAKLDRTRGQEHPFPPTESWTYTQHGPFNAVYETDRRSVYLMVQRQRRHPFLALFDGADPNASTPSRQTTTVPTQALYFLNDPFFHEQAARLANRLLSTSGESNQATELARIEALWQGLFQRAPSASEIARTQGFITAYPGNATEKWTAQVRVLLASNEFVFVD